MTCVSKRDKGMCSSGIAWVQVGEQTIWKRQRVCVWERGVREREREREGGEIKRERASDERERERERERGERGRLCP